MWSSKSGAGISVNPWNRSSWNHGSDSTSLNERNDISSGERREIKFPVNNFSISVSNDVVNSYRNTGTTEPSERVFGQTEWTRLWADKCFQLMAPTENQTETNLPPSIPRNFHSQPPLSRDNNQNHPARVTRLSCWDNGIIDCEEKVSIKSRLGNGNGGGPIRRSNDAKVRRDRSVPVYGQTNNRRMHSEAQNSQKEYGSCRIRRSPPHVVPSPRRAIHPSDIKTEPEEPKEWEMRRNLRKLRFENNATVVAAEPVNMALDELIAVKKNVNNSKKTSPLGKASYSGDLKIGDGISQSSDRRSFNPKIERPLNRPGKAVPQIIQTTSTERGRMVIVDGPSVAFEYGDQIYFDWEGINVCVKRLNDFGCRCIKVVVPGDKLGKGMAKNNQHSEDLQMKGTLLPCRENQNYKQMMLNIACKKDALIISNDVGKKTKLTGSGASKDAVERTSRFSFKARGSYKTISFAKIPNGSNEFSLEELLHN